MKLTQSEAEALCAEMHSFARTIIAEQCRKYPGQLRAEVISAGWMGLWQACCSYDPAGGSSKTAWVKTYIVNRIVDAIRVWSGRETEDSHRVKAAQQLDYVTWSELPESRMFPSPYQSARDAELRVRLQRILAGLPEREAFVLRQKYFEDRNQREIARSLHVHETRVGQLHSRALEHVREGLQA